MTDQIEDELNRVFDDVDDVKFCHICTKEQKKLKDNE